MIDLRMLRLFFWSVLTLEILQGKRRKKVVFWPTATDSLDDDSKIYAIFVAATDVDVTITQTLLPQ